MHLTYLLSTATMWAPDLPFFTLSQLLFNLTNLHILTTTSHPTEIQNVVIFPSIFQAKVNHTPTIWFATGTGNNQQNFLSCSWPTHLHISFIRYTTSKPQSGQSSFMPPILNHGRPPTQTLNIPSKRPSTSHFGHNIQPPTFSCQQQTFSIVTQLHTPLVFNL